VRLDRTIQYTPKDLEYRHAPVKPGHDGGAIANAGPAARGKPAGVAKADRLYKGCYSLFGMEFPPK
jgi:hypothetical protein